MRIPLRSPDVVRRMAERFDRFCPHWPHNKRLLALAAMYGYPSWEALVSSCDPAAPPIVYDQDLPSDQSRQERWLAMAQQTAIALNLLLPEAINLVNSVVPTMRMGVEKALWYQPNDTFDLALTKDPDVWWVGSSHHGHQLVPPGFAFSRAVRIADVATDRLSRRSVHEVSHEELFILEPLEIQRQTIHPHRYFRRKDLIIIEPIPFADALASPKKMEQHLQIFFNQDCATWPVEKRRQRLDEWLASIKTLKAAAGLAPTSRKRWVQFTVSARKKIGHEWFWPLRILEASSEALKAGETESLRIDQFLSQEFRGDPGYIQLT